MVRMVWVFLLLCVLLGCQAPPRQRITVGVRVSPPPGRRHTAAKIPIDLRIDYEWGVEPKGEPSSDD